MWAQLAAEQGHEAPGRDRDFIAESLSPDKVVAARARGVASDPSLTARASVPAPKPARSSDRPGSGSPRISAR